MNNYMKMILATAVTLSTSLAFAAHKGISVQATLRKADGTLPTATVNITAQILDPVTNCVLREEVHPSVPIVNGYFNIVLGAATATTLGANNPSPVLTIPETMDNATTRTSLSCVDSSNNPLTNHTSTYVPAQSHPRKLRISATVLGDPIIADFNMRAIGFAVNSENAENFGGKAPSAFVQTSANITQANEESIFSRYSILDAILSGTYTGNAATATALAATPAACSAGQYVSAMAANGTLTCSTPAGSGSGTVTNVTSANSYITVATGTTTPVITAVVGTAANTLAAGNDSRFTDSRAPNGSAGGDLSGTYPNPGVAKIAGKTVTLTTPATGDVLLYNGTDFVNSPTATDTTKLPLAGGTMSGGIVMGSQNITNIGFMTMSPSKTLHVSNNATDPGSLVAADKGKMWFNSTDNTMNYWNGTAVQALLANSAATFTGDRVMTTSSGGALQATNCPQDQVISFTALGAITCRNVSALAAMYLNGGNSFAGAATLGTNDAYSLAFKTDSSTRMTILATGLVGIGTASPNTTLDLAGAFAQRGMPAPAVSNAGEGRIYFDSTANKFKVSQHGGAYADLVGGGGTVTSVTAGTGLMVGVVAGASITGTGTLNIDVGTAANQIVQMTATSKLPAVDGSLLTSLDPTHLSAAVPIANGGTGQTSKTAAFDALSPNTTKGDITVNNGTNNIRLPAGASDGYVLMTDSASGAGVKWAQQLATTLSGIVPVANGGTGTSTGSITGTGALTFAAGGANSDVTLTPTGTGKVVVSTGVLQLSTAAATGGGACSTPGAIAVDSSGDLYICK